MKFFLLLAALRLFTFTELNAAVPDFRPLLLPSFAASDSEVCQFFCVNFFDLSNNNPTAWQWQFQGAIPSSSADQNPINICYNTPGSYDVTLTTTNANGTETVTMFDFITVYPTPPFPTITQIGFTLTSSPASFYQWQFNAYDIPGATNQSVTAIQTGYYTVIITDPNGCMNSSTLFVLVTGVDEVADEAGISIYPNPSSGSFMVEWLNGLTVDDVSIYVVNTLGQKVFSSECQSFGTSSFSPGVYSNKKEIDLSSVTPGVYFIEIQSENIFTCPDFFGVKKKIIITN